MYRKRGPAPRARRAAVLMAMLLSCAPAISQTAANEDAQGERQPAILADGSLPPRSPLAAAGGEVVLEVAVSADGRVSDVSILTDAPPFTELLAQAVRGWSFRPARDEEGLPVESRVLVAALFRDPAFYSGTTVGEPPRALGSGSPAIPFPTRTVSPPYPPQAFDDGISFLSVRVGQAGDIEDTQVLSSSPGFAEAARDAVQQWRFRPAEIDGVPVSTMAYVVIGFRQPVVP